MRFALSPEQIMFRDTARDLLVKHCPPGAVRAAWDEPAGRVPGLWARLAEVGVTGMTVPEAFGGLGLGDLDLCPVLEEAGRAAAPEPLVETTAVAAPLLREAAPEEIQGRWLPRVASGEAVIAIGLAHSPYVAFAGSADLFILQRGDELHAVEARDVSLTAQPSVDGARRLASVAWRPGPSTCIASGEAARRAAARAFDRGALATAAVLVGLARQMLDLTVEYAKVRNQFGKPIGSFQAVKHHLANALVAVEMARPMVLHAAYALHDGGFAPKPPPQALTNGDPEAPVQVSMAKARASDAALVTARAALQCHGAIGYAVEHDLHLWMKRAWALASEWGDAAWHRARVGAVILDSQGAT